MSNNGTVKELQEAGIEIRRQNHRKTVKEYKESKDGKGASSNLTPNEQAGLKSLKKRMKDGEIIIMSLTNPQNWQLQMLRPI